MEPVVKRRRPVGWAAARFSNTYPQWMELAAELLFRRAEHEPYDLQHAVAEGLRLAHEMGQNGRNPPMPAHQGRTYTPPETDPEIEPIAQEMRLLAWSPMAGTERPEGHFQWKMQQHYAEQASKAPLVRRSKPAAPVQAPVVVRRRR